MGLILFIIQNLSILRNSKIVLDNLSFVIKLLNYFRKKSKQFLFTILFYQSVFLKKMLSHKVTMIDYMLRLITK